MGIVLCAEMVDVKGDSLKLALVAVVAERGAGSVVLAHKASLCADAH